MQGKQRLLLVVGATAAVLLVFAMLGSRGASGQHESAAASATPVTEATASPAEMDKLKSWVLNAEDLPSGTYKLNETELPNYGAAMNDPNRLKQIEAQGRLTGYIQQWRQDTAQFEYQNETDLFRSPAQARSWLSINPPSDSKNQVQILAAPKLGDASRMYGWTTTANNGTEYQGYEVAWTRGRVLLTIFGDGPAAGFQSDQMLAAARALDARASRAPIN